MKRRALVALGLAIVQAALPGCEREPRNTGAPEREVVVFAAASLQDAFTTLAATFESRHPGVDVKLSFAGSQQLRTQIEHGATFDVFASADEMNVRALVRSSLVGQPSTFAENEPVVVVAPGAASIVGAFADLPLADRLVVGTQDVPIGRYTLEILDRASTERGPDFRSKVESKVASRELTVRQVLSKVALGEAQAGVVYRSDALGAMDRVRVVEIPKQHNVVARYPVAIAARAPHPALARAWVDLLRSAEGRSALEQAGFRTPEEE